MCGIRGLMCGIRIGARAEFGGHVRSRGSRAECRGSRAEFGGHVRNLVRNLGVTCGINDFRPLSNKSQQMLLNLTISQHTTRFFKQTKQIINASSSNVFAAAWTCFCCCFCCCRHGGGRRCRRCGRGGRLDFTNGPRDLDVDNGSRRRLAAAAAAAAAAVSVAAAVGNKRR